MQIVDLIKCATVAAPCPAKWSDMVGDDKVRFCTQCNLNVHNTTMMTDEEVLQLVLDAASGKRVCGRLYRRTDGTLLTSNCPVGVEKLRARVRERLRQRIHQAAGFIAGMMAFCVSVVETAAADSKTGEPNKTTNQRKMRFHGTVRAETDGVKATDIPASSTPVPPPRTRVTKDIAAGMFLIPTVTPGMIESAEKLLAEAKLGKDNARIAAEHERLGNLYRVGNRNIYKSEANFETAYRLQMALGNYVAAKELAIGIVSDYWQTGPSLLCKAKWAKRAGVALPSNNR